MGGCPPPILPGPRAWLDDAQHAMAGTGGHFGGPRARAGDVDEEFTARSEFREPTGQLGVGDGIMETRVVPGRADVRPAAGDCLHGICSWPVPARGAPTKVSLPQPGHSIPHTGMAGRQLVLNAAWLLPHRPVSQASRFLLSVAMPAAARGHAGPSPPGRGRYPRTVPSRRMTIYRVVTSTERR